MFGSLSKHTLKAKLCHLHANVVAIDQGRIAKHLWLLAKILFNLLHLFLHVDSKAFLVDQR